MSSGVPTVAAEIEKKFDELSNITNQIALINSDYEGDIDDAILEMRNSTELLKSWDVSSMSSEHRLYYLSHMSFHREIIADIISEARFQLPEDRRHHLKALVHYHRELCSWLSQVQKKHRNSK